MQSNRVLREQLKTSNEHTLQSALCKEAVLIKTIFVNTLIYPYWIYVRNIDEQFIGLRNAVHLLHINVDCVSSWLLATTSLLDTWYHGLKYFKWKAHSAVNCIATPDCIADGILKRAVCKCRIFSKRPFSPTAIILRIFQKR